MIIKNENLTFGVRGDIHGKAPSLDSAPYNDPNNAIIILGDHGLFFAEDTGYKKSNQKLRKALNSANAKFYMFDGNHDFPIDEVESVELVYDENVQGEVYIELANPNLRYFKRVGIYTINGFRCLIIAGAYSVDKYYRLENHWTWYKNEQMKEEEKEFVRSLKGQKFDFVLTHTCPYSVMPTDLFLNAIDQSLVDNSMELFFDEVKDSITFKAWCFGHYHQDRIEAPYFEMFLNDYDTLENIAARWDRYDNTKELDWWLSLSPRFYLLHLGDSVD